MDELLSSFPSFFNLVWQLISGSAGRDIGSLDEYVIELLVRVILESSLVRLELSNEAQPFLISMP